MMHGLIVTCVTELHPKRSFLDLIASVCWQVELELETAASSCTAIRERPGGTRSNEAAC